MKVDKKFLLKKSKTFCMAPWVEVHVTTIGEIVPCCAADTGESHAFGNTQRGDTLEESWNSKRARKLRMDMLQEKRNGICKDCHAYEDLGRKSERDWYNKDFAKYFDRVEMTKDGGELEIFDPPFIDIRFSNVCNLRCRMCGPHFSTSWYKHAMAEGRLDPSYPLIIRPIEDPEELWKQVEMILPTVERIHFAGGEPLVMEEHYRILKMLLDVGRTDVLITYNTNFADLNFRGESVLDYWKKFQHVLVCASLDGMGNRGEYMRKGLDWSTVVENRNLMKKICSQHHFHIVSIVSIMNILHMPDFYKWCVDTKFIARGNISLYYLSEPEYISIQGLSQDKKQEVIDKYNVFFDEYLDDDIRTCEYFQAILNYMQSDSTSINFRDGIMKLDKIRNENFEKVFPELVGI